MEKDNEELRVKTTYNYDSKVIIQNGEEDIHYTSLIFSEILIKRGTLK